MSPYRAKRGLGVVALVLAGLVVSSSSPFSVASAAKVALPTGTITINASGLPGSVSPIFEVVKGGSKSYIRGRKVSQTVSVGKYVVKPKPVYTGRGKWIPRSATLGVQIKSGKTTRVSVQYRLASTVGELSITVSRVSRGVTPNVIVTGPNRFKVVIQKSSTLRSLKQGRYTISAPTVSTVDGTVVPVVSDPQPIILAGNKSNVRVNYGTLAAPNLVMVDSGSIILDNESAGIGFISVSDPQKFVVGAPIVLPATDLEAQHVVRVASINGNAITTAPGSLYDALPVAVFEYQPVVTAAPDLVLDDQSVRSLSSSGEFPFSFFSSTGTGGFTFECADEDSSSLTEKLSKFNPIFEVKEASFNWNLLDISMSKGPSQVTAIFRTGLDTEWAVDLSREMSATCAATLRLSVPVASIYGIPIFVRFEVTLELGTTRKAELESIGTVSIIPTVDFGFRYNPDNGISPVYQPDLHTSFEFTPIGLWSAKATANAYTGLGLSLTLSPFEQAKKIDFLNLTASADLNFGVRGRLGAGIQTKVAYEGVKNGSLALDIGPYWYGGVKAFIEAHASVETGPEVGGPTIKFSVNLDKEIIQDEDRPFGPRLTKYVTILKEPSVVTDPKGTSTTIPPTTIPPTTIPSVRTSSTSTTVRSIASTTIPSTTTTTSSTTATTTVPTTTTTATAGSPRFSGLSLELLQLSTNQFQVRPVYAIANGPLYFSVNSFSESYTIALNGSVIASGSWTFAALTGIGSDTYSTDVIATGTGCSNCLRDTQLSGLYLNAGTTYVLSVTGGIPGNMVSASRSITTNG